MKPLATHNGTWTVQSIATGEWRTFKVKTVKGEPSDDNPLGGKRIIGLLTGPDNTSDYRGFGFVLGERIAVWKRCRGGLFDQYARMLERLAAHVEAGRVKVLFEGRCRRCNAPLTVPTSIESGIGPTCATKER